MSQSQMWLENGNWIPDLLMDARGIEEAKNLPESEEDLPEPDEVEPHDGIYTEHGGEGG